MTIEALTSVAPESPAPAGAPPAPSAAPAAPAAAPAPEAGDPLAPFRADKTYAKALEPYKDLGGLVKSHVEAQKMLGARVALPGPEAKPEEWDALYSKIGWPKAPTDYGVKLPEVPERVKWDDAEVEAALKVAHGLRLTASQVQRILENEAEARRARAQEIEAKGAEAVRAIQAKYGHEYPAKLAAADRAMQDAPPEILEVFENLGGEARQWMLERAILLGEALAEDRSATAPQTTPGLPFEEAQALRKDLTSPLYTGDAATKARLEAQVTAAYEREAARKAAQQAAFAKAPTA